MWNTILTSVTSSAVHPEPWRVYATYNADGKYFLPLWKRQKEGFLHPAVYSSLHYDADLIVYRWQSYIVAVKVRYTDFLIAKVSPKRQWAEIQGGCIGRDCTLHCNATYRKRLYVTLQCHHQTEFTLAVNLAAGTCGRRNYSPICWEHRDQRFSL